MGCLNTSYHHQSLLPAVLWFWNPQSQWEQFNKIWDVHRIQRWILRMIWAELQCSSWILSLSVLRLTVLFQPYGKSDSVSMTFIKGSIVLQYHGGQGNLMLKTYAWLTRKTYPAILFMSVWYIMAHEAYGWYNQYASIIENLLIKLDIIAPFPVIFSLHLLLFIKCNIFLSLLNF